MPASTRCQAGADESLMGVTTYALYVTVADSTKTLTTATWSLDSDGVAPTPVVSQSVSQ